jgi:hypothetical protein
MAVALQLLNVTDFQPCIGSDFVIYFSDEVTGIAQLEKVVPLPRYDVVAERKPFSITLQTTQNSRKYQQRIYTISHPALGTMDIFLVPVACTEKGLQYEAIFS